MLKNLVNFYSSVHDLRSEKIKIAFLVLKQK